MDSALNERAALVTGGSRGIGAAIARRLARDGADVAITYVNNHAAAESVAKDIRAVGSRALVMQVDLTDSDAVRGAVESAADAFGRLDILVNNAGIFPAADVREASLEAFDAAIAANVRSVFVAAQAAVRHMREGGRIISIGSNLVDRAGRPGIGLYVTSKSALVGLTKAMARDFGPLGITANIIHPGPTDTDMNPADGPRAEKTRSLMAISRYGKPEQIASLVAWLASPDAQFATGSAYTIDGGVNA